MIACENSGHNIYDDFPEVRKTVEAGATSKPKKDYELTRYTMGLFNRTDINKEVEALKDIPGGVLLDVRTEEEYAEGHIPNSINVPVEKNRRYS